MPSHVSALPPPSQDRGKNPTAGTSVVNPFQAIQAPLGQVVTMASGAEEMVLEHESALQAREAEASARADEFRRLYEEARDKLVRERGFNSALTGRQVEALEKIKALEVELKIAKDALSEKTDEIDDLKARLNRARGSTGLSFCPVPPGCSSL